VTTTSCNAIAQAAALVSDTPSKDEKYARREKAAALLRALQGGLCAQNCPTSGGVPEGRERELLSLW
jgi:hypothetical protein